jgi:hypothetical protein
MAHLYASCVCCGEPMHDYVLDKKSQLCPNCEAHDKGWRGQMQDLMAENSTLRAEIRQLREQAAWREKVAAGG